jgi:DNA-binding PadR family transcriptional regulator
MSRPDAHAPPLRPAVYHILLSLVGGDRHGLGIADHAERVSEGAVELGPGTLYRSLSEMAEAGLIDAVSAPEPGADPRRKYYSITSRGRELLLRETERLGRLVAEARAHAALAENT